MAKLKIDGPIAPEDARELIAHREVVAFDIRPGAECEAGWIAGMRHVGVEATSLKGGFEGWADEDLPTQPSDDFGEAASSKQWDKR
jgi:rhodanese-related sulfurtransferase